jgi:hypothetical protein
VVGRRAARRERARLVVFFTASSSGSGWSSGAMAAPQPQPQQQMDTKKWPVVYPAYIDADKTIALVRPPTRGPALRAAGSRSV